MVQPSERVDPWWNRLVIQAITDPAGPEGLLAVPDASPGSDVHGVAILRTLGLPSAKGSRVRLSPTR